MYTGSSTVCLPDWGLESRSGREPLALSLRHKGFVLWLQLRGGETGSRIPLFSTLDSAETTRLATCLPSWLPTWDDFDRKDEVERRAFSECRMASCESWLLVGV
jgi:hypothetical protein